MLPCAVPVQVVTLPCESRPTRFESEPVCTVLGVDYKKRNRPAGVPRPIPIVDTSKEVKLLTELL